MTKTLDVPFIMQNHPNSCGAAALEMIYKYFGIQGIDQSSIMLQYQELEPHGTGNLRITTDALIADATSRGLTSQWMRAPFRDTEKSLKLLRILVKELEIPVIVCQKYDDDFRNRQIGHFRVVIGIDDRFIYLNDPDMHSGSKNAQWPISKFMEYWQPTGENVTGGIFCMVSNKTPDQIPREQLNGIMSLIIQAQQ